MTVPGASTLQLIKSPNRVLQPLLRTRPKGGNSPGWVRITWDEAYSRIVKKMMEIYRAEIEPKIKKHDGYYLVGRDSPIAWVGSAYCTNEENYLFKKFMSLIGSSNIEHTARICHSTTVAALANTFGFGAMTNHWTDWINTKRFLIVGANPAE